MHSFCVSVKDSSDPPAGFAEPCSTDIAARQGLVGGFGLILDTGNMHFMVPSNPVSSFAKLMVKRLK